MTVKDTDAGDVLLGVETGATLSSRLSPAAVGALTLEVDSSTIGLSNMLDAVGAALVTGASDASGAFTLRNVPAGSFTLVARTADGRVGRLAIEPAGVDQSGLVVQLGPRASIAGRVVDPSGAPVAGVRVRATDRSEGRVLDRPGGGAAVTGADGGFRIVGLAAGRVRLQVTDDQGLLAWADTAHRTAPDRPIEVELAERQDLAGVTLTIEARDGVIRGVVLGPDRQPAPDTWVTAQLAGSRAPRTAAEGGAVVITVGAESGPDEASAGAEPDDDDEELAGGGSHTVLTGEGGRFEIPRLRRGAYTLIAEGKRGGAGARRTSVKPGDAVTLVLEPLGSLAGTVTAGGAPVAEYRIECTGAGKTVSRRVAAADGAYAFERLRPGAYACSVVSQRGPARGTAAVSGAARLNLAIGAWGTLTGSIVDARTGAPLPKLRIAVGGGGNEAADLEHFLGNGPTTDAAGRFEVGKQPARTGHLIALSAMPLQMVAQAEFTLEPGQRLDLGAIKGLPPRAGAPGTLGMQVEAAGDRVVVASVEPGGPAAKGRDRPRRCDRGARRADRRCADARDRGAPARRRAGRRADARRVTGCFLSSYADCSVS